MNGVSRMKYIKLLSELNRTDLPVAGGKGANLGELLRTGLPVPDGFVITTDGYRVFTECNHLDDRIQQALEARNLDDPSILDKVSSQIQSMFIEGNIPDDLSGEIFTAYNTGGDRNWACAIRSSATAEDLPDLSFAGQQDTYLNIVGEKALLESIVRCWASLWTARAIGYRARNTISHQNVALAVVVQKMVQSEASGVLFTANPLTGKRSQTVIDATFGLGEALVSGQVDPDHYVVDMEKEIILTRTLGAKAVAVIGKSGGGTVLEQKETGEEQALPDEQILHLARYGRQAEESFGSPQDMEWAWADGKLFIVQSRPITSLYPLPPAPPDNLTEMLLSFGVWQGMLDPYTPLGQDVFKYLIVGFGKKFGETTTAEKQRAVLTSGGRIFVNLTGLIQSRFGQNFVILFLSSIDPETAKIVEALLKEPRFSRFTGMTLREKANLFRVVIELIRNVIINLSNPARGRKRLEDKIDFALEVLRSRCDNSKDLRDLVDVFVNTTTATPAAMMPALVGAIAGGQAPYQIMLRKLSFPGSQDLLFDLTRGLPHNVTTQMDLHLWQTASVIKMDADSVAFFQKNDTNSLVASYNEGKLPAAAQAAVRNFLVRYGIRGVGEIDLGRPRWCEHPSNLFQALKSYLDIDPSVTPDVLFRNGEEKAAEAANRIIEAVRRRPFGSIKACVIKGMISRFRELGGLRETPKFFVVRLLSVFRYALIAEGKKLVSRGIFTKPDDAFFLYLHELRALGNGETRDWMGLVAERRQDYERELRRTRIPRVLLSDGTAYYDAPSRVDDLPGALTGSPVSAGVTEGLVHVILDPHGEQLQAGEILVCTATDPAWTPLFLAAGGLITEVGGMMTHGSVVAREYGIPAVVGVSRATERLKTGQRVRMNGSAGTIEVLD